MSDDWEWKIALAIFIGLICMAVWHGAGDGDAASAIINGSSSATLGFGAYAR